MKCDITVVVVVAVSCVLYVSDFCSAEVSEITTVNSTLSSVNNVTEVPTDITTVDPHRFRNAIKNGVGAITKRILRFVLQNEDFGKLKVTPQCIRHMMKMLAGLKGLKLWALQMLDASGKLPNGMFSGTTTSFGDFDGCLKINANGEFTGKYCLLEIFPRFEDILPLAVNFLQSRGSDPLLENLILNLNDTKIRQLAAFRTSMCVPSSCSREDIQIFGGQLMKAANIGWRVQINSCQAKEPVILDSTEISVLCVIAILLMLVGAGSLIDLYLKITTDDESYKEESNTFIRFLLCFSAYSNTLRVLKEDDSAENIKVFHVLKTLAMFWTILIHIYGIFFIARAGSSVLNISDFLKEGTFQFILQANYGIEAFFFISAVLLVRGFKMKDGIKIIFVQLFRRLWRLTPPFMFVIACSFLVHHIGSGPVWKESMYNFIDNCRSNWWTNLIYINNYLEVEDMCLFWMWYIAADTHLYIAGLIVLLIAHRFRRTRYLVFIVAIIASIIAVVVNNDAYEVQATVMLSAFQGPDGFLSYVTHGYFPTHVHAIPTSLGLLVGYILLSRSKFEIPLTVNIIGFLVSVGLVLVVIFGPYEWTQGAPPTIGVATLYTCSTKIIWPLSLGWITLSLTTGKSEVFSTISGWPMFYTINRLTYMAYLVHPLVLFTFLGNSKVLLHTGHPTLVFLYLAVLLAGYGTAFIFHLVIEAPFMELDKMIWSSGKAKSWATNNTEHYNGGFEHDHPKYNGNELRSVTNGKPKIEP